MASVSPIIFLGPLLAAWLILFFILLIVKYVTYTDRSEQPMYDEQEEAEKDVNEHMANENEVNEHMANENEVNEHMVNENEVNEHMANENEVNEHMANENEA